MKTNVLCRAFTLIELLVVIAVITVLIGLIAPALEKAMERSRLAACGANLHAIAIALNTYANEFNSAVPRGDATPSTLSPARNWNTIGSNQLWVASAQHYDGPGILTTSWLSDARVFVCPSDNDGSAKDTLKKNLGSATADAYSSYLYRQLDQTTSDRLTLPGLTTKGNPARAIMLDWQSKGPFPYTRASHDYGEFVNVLYIDGHVDGSPNTDDVFTADVGDFLSMPDSYLLRVDQLWLNADFAETGNSAAAPTLP